MNTPLMYRFEFRPLVDSTTLEESITTIAGPFSPDEAKTFSESEAIRYYREIGEHYVCRWSPIVEAQPEIVPVRIINPVLMTIVAVIVGILVWGFLR